MANIYLETYGCQMNFADSEIVASILQKEGHTVVTDIEQADYILINTCAIRDNAEPAARPPGFAATPQTTAHRHTGLHG